METNYKYKKISDFKKAHPNLFKQLHRRGELERLHIDMGWKIQIQKPSGYWNIKENCIEESKKRNDKNDFRINSSGAYEASFRNGWLQEICELNGWRFKKRKPSGYWDIKENCIEESKKSNSKKEFMINSPGAYDAAKRNGWLDEIFELNAARGWNIKENCIEESKKSNSKKKFKNNSSGAYDAAKRNGWLDEISELNKWKTQIQKPYGYWDIKENCIGEAKKYEKYSDFIKNGSAYNAAKKNGWVNEICNLMNWTIRQTKPPGFWTKERCMQEALKYNTISEWRTNNQSSHDKAKKENWFEECTAHMIKLKK
jgi:hypothetical protein